jgi:hypothetical protein
VRPSRGCRWRQSPALLRGALGLAASLYLVTPAFATEAISYQWKTPRVTVTWQEGNSSSADSALLLQVGHWKRVAQSLWAQKPAAPPLELIVSFYDEEMGSDGPRVSVRAGSRSISVTAPLTEAKVADALYRVRDGVAASAALPPDDVLGRVSNTGEWVSSVSWRGNGPELWLAPPVPGRVFRVPAPAGASLQDQLILGAPRWAPQSRLLTWVQGGRLVLFNGRDQKVQLITPKNRRVIDFDWSRYANLLLVRFDDNTFQILDLRRSKAIAMSDLLRDALPMGEFFWSPSGRRLLFRTQSTVVTTSLLTPRGAANALDRFINRLIGEPEPPKTETGPNTERLAVLDLGAQRLDTYPVQGSPLEGAPLRSVLWSPEEDLLVASVGIDANGPQQLVRFPLRIGEEPSTVLDSPQPLRGLGHRSENGQSRYVFLQGKRLLAIDPRAPSQPAFPYPADQSLQYQLTAGPRGGYLGVEGEEVTTDEPQTAALLESVKHTGMAQKQWLENGLFGALDLDCPAVAAAKGAIDASTIDLDLYPARGREVITLTRSEDGGAGRVTSISAEGGFGSTARTEAVSERLDHPKKVIDIPMLDEPFPLIDARTGLEFFAQRYQTLNGKRMLIAGFAVALLIAAIFLSRRRRKA